MKTRYNAVVIGSGHNGLVAAAYLARAGQSVLVLERSQNYGGATVSSKIFPDFDAYLSRYSYLISLLPSIIVEELELDFLTRRREIASFTPYQTSGLLLSNVDSQRSSASMRLLTGSDKEWQRYQEFIALQAELAQLAWPTLLEPLRSRIDFKQRLHSKQLKRAWDCFIERPLGEALEAQFDHDLVRGLVMTDAKIGVFADAHSESLLQNKTFLYHVIGQGSGEWRVPVGGIQTLVAQLLAYCRSRGVGFFNRAPAMAIEPSSNGSTVIFKRGDQETHIDADNVLVNAGPRTFARLVGEPWSARLEDEGSVVKVNMLLQRLPRLLAGNVKESEAFCGSLHIAEGYEQLQAAYQQAARGVIPDPAPFEVYCHTLTDDSILAPQLNARGFHTLTLFGLDMPYRLFTEEHDTRRALALKRYLSALNRLCAEPFEDCIARDRAGDLCIEIHSPQDLEHNLDLDQGNIFHSAPSWFFTDDENQVGTWGVETGYAGIYKAGSSALRGGAVSGIPGRNAAMCILERARNA